MMSSKLVERALAVVLRIQRQGKIEARLQVRRVALDRLRQFGQVGAGGGGGFARQFERGAGAGDRRGIGFGCRRQGERLLRADQIVRGDIAARQAGDRVDIAAVPLQGLGKSGRGGVDVARFQRGLRRFQFGARRRRPCPRRAR